eukprot:jgi/Galph1/5809/GphlegSOOS_G4522.1
MEEILQNLLAGTSCRKRKENTKLFVNKTDGTTENSSYRVPYSFTGDIPEGKKRKSIDTEQCSKLKQEDLQERNLLENRLRKYFHIRANRELLAPSFLFNFEELKTVFAVSKELVDVLESFGYSEPTPVQRQVIPCMLADMQVLACAATGSGKTLAFVIPLIAKLLRDTDRQTQSIRKPYALILEPTKELAIQTNRVVQRLVMKLNIRCSCLIKKQSSSNDNLYVDMIVATPYSMLMIMNENRVDLSSLKQVVIDEADKLFEEQFLQQIDGILAHCQSFSINKHLFSATLPDKIEMMARSFIDDPVRIIVGRGSGNGSFSCIDSVQQQLVYTGTESGKRFALHKLFHEGLASPVLIFVQDKRRVIDLARFIQRWQTSFAFIHADCSEEHRRNSIIDFKKGNASILITTDLICRGMDFRCVQTVINYDFPTSLNSYIHRIGRTGRAGRKGIAISFFNEEDQWILRPVANFAAACGALSIPKWIFDLPLPSKTQRKQLEKRPPEREEILRVRDE